MINDSLIRASAMIGVPDVIRELGGDPAAFLEQFHLREEMISNPKQMMPYLTLIHMLERAAEQFDCIDFGMRVGLKQHLNVLGPIAILAQNSATMEQALQHIIRYIAYHSPSIYLALDPPNQGKPRAHHFDITLTKGQARAQTVEMSLVLSNRVMRLLGGPDYQPREVRFRHAPLSPLARYRALFKCPVKFRSATNATVLPEAILSRPLEHSDPALLKTMEDFISQTLAAHNRSLRDNVRALVIALLPLEQRCTITLIARHLALSERTLQRGLQKEGITFEGLIDDVRRELAEDYLKEKSMSMSQLAGLLGYGQQSSLNRACLRWFGKSPGAARSSMR